MQKRRPTAPCERCRPYWFERIGGILIGECGERGATIRLLVDLHRDLLQKEILVDLTVRVSRNCPIGEKSTKIFKSDLDKSIFVEKSTKPGPDGVLVSIFGRFFD